MREYLAKHMRASGRHQPDRGLVLASRARADDVDRLRPIELVDLKTTIDHRHIPAEQVDEEALAVGEHGLEERDRQSTPPNSRPYCAPRMAYCARKKPITHE